MKKKTVFAKRKLSSFFLFYKQLFSFSLMVSMSLFMIEYVIESIQPGAVVRLPDPMNFSKGLSYNLPIYAFIGALGLTHFVQKKQYNYYRNQGSSIKSLIFFSWIANCFTGVLLFIFNNTAGQYV